jgi:hypothetical protein
MFNILSPKGDINHMYIDVLSPSQGGHHQGNEQMLARMRRKRSRIHCWWECKLVKPLWKSVWRVLEKLKLELPYDPAIKLLGIHSKDVIPLTFALCI